MQMVKKSNDRDFWPLQVDSVAYNSSQIFYTDKVRNTEGGGIIVASIRETKKNKWILTFALITTYALDQPPKLHSLLRSSLEVAEDHECNYCEIFKIVNFCPTDM